MTDSKKQLSWLNEDIECKFGFHGAKFTGTNQILTLIVGAMIMVLFYSALIPFRGKTWMIDMFFHGGPEKRSFIPYYTVFLSAWALAILLIKNLKLKVQQKALSVNILPENYDFILTSHTAKQIIEKIHQETADPAHFILLDRIERALSNLKNLGNVSAVADCLKNQADNDESCLTSSYTVLKGFIWAIPVLGFIGTVLGLSDSVGGFGAVVQNSDNIETIKQALGNVTAGLGTAFETTLIALVLALIIQLLMTFTMSKEEKFLDDCSDFCHKNIISKMKSLSEKDLED